MFKVIPWSEAIAIGSLAFIDKVKGALGFRVESVPIVQAVQPLRSVQVVVKANTKFAHRDVIEGEGSYALREPAEAYGLGLAAESEALRAENTFFWYESVDEATI